MHALYYFLFMCLQKRQPPAFETTSFPVMSYSMKAGLLGSSL